MSVLRAVDLADSLEVPAAFEGRLEPHAHDRECQFLGNGACSQGKDVGIVVRPAPDGGLLVPADAAADAADPVGDDRLAVARTTQHNAALVFASGDRLGHGADEIRIVTWGVGIRAEIADGMTSRAQHGLDGFLVVKACVVGSDGDGEGAHASGKNGGGAAAWSSRVAG